MPASEREQPSYRAIDEIASGIADRLQLAGTEGDYGVDRLSARVGAVSLYESIGRLSDEELDRLIVLLPILCFGQQDATRLDNGESLMNRVAVNLGVGMRTWWRPDAAFLSTLRRDQIMPITVEAGAAEHLQGLHDRSKKARANIRFVTLMLDGPSRKFTTDAHRMWRNRIIATIHALATNGFFVRTPELDLGEQPDTISRERLAGLVSL